MRLRRSTRHRNRAAALIATAVIGSAVLAPSLATAAPAAPHATSVKISLRDINFGVQRVATVGRVRLAKITNNGTTPLTLNQIAFRSGDRSDFIAGTGCFQNGRPATLAVGASCRIGIRFVPRALNTRTAVLAIADSAPGSPHLVTLRGIGTQGYYLAGVRGGVAYFGDAGFHGDVLGRSLSAPIVAMATTPNGAGYWLLGSDGGIFAFGNARFFGSTGAMRLSQPVLGMASNARGNGYWLVAGDGGIFTFGKTHFYGSTGAMHLNQPVVGMASTPSGKGYWLVAADGGIFSFGNARFFGSTGALSLAQPIIGMVSTPSGRGYWLVARDGGIFAFGDAHFYGSGGGRGLGSVTGMAVTSDGGGYWMSNTVGQVFTFGNAPYYGDLYRHNVIVGPGVVATAPKLRPAGFAGTVLQFHSNASLGASLLPRAVPRLDGN